MSLANLLRSDDDIDPSLNGRDRDLYLTCDQSGMTQYPAGVAQEVRRSYDSLAGSMAHAYALKESGTYDADNVPKDSSAALEGFKALGRPSKKLPTIAAIH